MRNPPHIYEVAILGRNFTLLISGIYGPEPSRNALRSWAPLGTHVTLQYCRSAWLLDFAPILPGVRRERLPASRWRQR
jgi:hypothetical protein